MNKKELLDERNRLLKAEDRLYLYEKPTENEILYTFKLDEYINDPIILYFMSEDGYSSLYDILEKIKYFNLPYERLENALEEANDFLMNNDYDENFYIGNKELEIIHNEIIEEMKIIQSHIDVDREKRDLEKEEELYSYFNFKEELIEKQLKNVDMQLEKYQDEYLEKMVNIALENIRKKIKYPKRYFYSIFRNITVCWDREIFLDRYTYGSYYRDNNLIKIKADNLINRNHDLFTHKNNSERQRQRNINLLDVITHELIHHFVKDEFDITDSINIWSDASPIFMGVLLRINPNERNSYECFKEFKKTDTYKRMMECKNFTELGSLCVKLILKMKKLLNDENKIKSKKMFFVPTVEKYKYEEYDIILSDEIPEEMREFFKGWKHCNVGIDWINVLEKYKIS